MFPKTGSCNIRQHLDDTKDKTDPYLQGMETKKYKISTSYFVDTPRFSK